MFARNRGQPTVARSLIPLGLATILANFAGCASISEPDVVMRDTPQTPLWTIPAPTLAMTPAQTAEAMPAPTIEASDATQAPLMSPVPTLEMRPTGTVEAATTRSGRTTTTLR